MQIHRDDCNGLLAPPPHALLRSSTTRKPRRSSPLAGPALNDKDDFTRNSHRTSPSLSLYDFDRTIPSIQEVCSRSSQGRARPTSMLCNHSSLSYTLYQRSLIIPKRQSMPHNRLTRPTSVFFRPDSNLHRASLKAEECVPNFQPPSSSRHRKCPDGLAVATTPGPINVPPQGIPVMTINGEDVPQPPSPPSADPQLENTSPRAINSWYTFNTYAEIPRFSRLSLATDVVLPVSAKEYKKRQRQQQQRHQRPGHTSSGSGSFCRPAIVSTSPSGSNHQSFQGASSASSLSRGSIRPPNEAHLRLSSRSAASPPPPRRERVLNLQKKLIIPEEEASTPFVLPPPPPPPPSSPTSTTSGSSSSSPPPASSPPQRTRSNNSLADSLATTFSMPSVAVASSKTSVSGGDDDDDDDAVIHNNTIDSEEAHYSEKISSVGGTEPIIKKQQKKLLTKSRQTHGGGGENNESKEPAGVLRRHGSIQAFVKRLFTTT